MRREVPVSLSNEKVTYIEFQDDLWVTFDPWVFIFQGHFWPFIFPKWLLELLFYFNYNKLENMKTLHIPHFGLLQKIIFTIFHKIFYNNILQYYNFIPLSCGSVCSMPRVVIISFPLLSWRCGLFLHQGLYCTSCTPTCSSQTCTQMMNNGSTPSMI